MTVTSKVSVVNSGQGELAGQVPVADGSGGFAWDDGTLHTRSILTYGTSITPDASAGRWFTITASNATAFTINAPINPPAGLQTQAMTIEVRNASGGAMGAITWNGIFVFQGLTWTNPANLTARFVRFDWNGSKWIATAIATANYTY